jgi:hypothetical protein
MSHAAYVPIGAPKSLTQCRRFFREPQSAKQRAYEALRAYFVEANPSQQVARAFGYSPGAFRVMCHQFRREPTPVFFLPSQLGPRTQPKKTAAHALVIALRKRNYSVYDISEALKERQIALSPTAVREILTADGFAPLPRRLDDDRPVRPRATVEPVADARAFSRTPRQFVTRCGGLFLFVPDLVRLPVDALAQTARLPGSRMIPAGHALRACLALKLWSLERKSHVMALVADEGLAFFSGLNVTPKKSYFAEYASRIDPPMTSRLLAAWHDQVTDRALFPARSFNLDFHSVPYYGTHPVIERHYVSMRSRRQKSVLVFLAQDADGHAFCYSNADLRKGEEPEAIFRFIRFWERTHGERPRHLVFDSRLTTYPNLARLDAELGITFITLRRRSPALLSDVAQLPRSAWRTVELDVATRKYRTPRVYEQTVRLAGRDFRQLYILDLGHDEPTILVTNDRRTSAAKLITRYAQRMLIENALSDAVRFFHLDALSSAVGLKVDFDMALLVVGSGLYRLLARTMRGYADAQARQIFRDLVDMPATINVTPTEVRVQFHRRAHLPIVMASGLLNTSVTVPWWNDLPLRLTV